ncbi:hypothetical protein GCM10023075_14080 [Streptosporangium album]
MVPAGAPAGTSLPATHRPAHTVVGLCGDIDVTTSPALREYLLIALRRSTDLLVFDLSEVSFRDVSGLAVLIGVQRRARPRGVAVRLASPRPPTVELLRVTGLERCLTVHPTLRDALGSGPVPARRGQPDAGGSGGAPPRFTGRSPALTPKTAT